jgi:magnesium chelatase family protein
MLATVSSASLLGVRGHPVTVEVHVSGGLPSFTVVGLPDASCREARDRVRAAIMTSGLSWPSTRVTVNLAPSGVRKAGAGLDLAIAIGVLIASEQLDPVVVTQTAFVGELGLDGSIRPVVGALPLAAAAEGTAAVVAVANHGEVDLVPELEVRSAPDLGHLVAVLRGVRPWADPEAPVELAPPSTADDLAGVKGQPTARRAVEVAAAGGHHVLLVGPPGAGKTMLAKSIVGLLPPLSAADALDVTTVHSASGLPLRAGGLVTRPPFRAPHHTSSTIALVGGGTQSLRPGEISCAHGGVLFLDELGEFSASVLDALRQPLEEGVVRVARAWGSTTLPARVLLVAAMNPCPCGEAASPDRCRCTEAARQRYFRRVSGPLLDRFDLRIHVDRPPASALFEAPDGEGTAVVACRVAGAREIAEARGVAHNSAIEPSLLDELAPLCPSGRSLLERAMSRGQLTARGVHRVRRVARTVADLDIGDGPVTETHVATALAMRSEVFGPSHIGISS